MDTIKKDKLLSDHELIKKFIRQYKKKRVKYNNKPKKNISGTNIYERYKV